MREIEFRGKVINFAEPEKNGRWAYGFLSREICGEEYYYFIGKGMWPQRVDKKTVGQWTGLKEKNGVKVFEGDIVKADANDHHFIVLFDEDYCRYMLRYYVDKEPWGLPLEKVNESDIEVIGNINDNPELLEGV